MLLDGEDLAAMTLSLDQALLLPHLWTPYLDKLHKVAWHWARLGAIGSQRSEKIRPCAEVLGLAAVMYLNGIFGDESNLRGERTSATHSLRVNMQQWQVHVAHYNSAFCCSHQ
eukprot:1196467-Pleurochrysis_carterae.AAC.1